MWNWLTTTADKRLATGSGTSNSSYSNNATTQSVARNQAIDEGVRWTIRTHCVDRKSNKFLISFLIMQSRWPHTHTTQSHFMSGRMLSVHSHWNWKMPLDAEGANRIVNVIHIIPNSNMYCQQLTEWQNSTQKETNDKTAKVFRLSFGKCRGRYLESIARKWWVGISCDPHSHTAIELEQELFKMRRNGEQVKD